MPRKGKLKKGKREAIEVLEAAKVNVVSVKEFAAKSHVSGRKIWINFEAYQRFIRHINPWKKCSDLRPFSKYLAEPILRPLRSKDIRR